MKGRPDRLLALDGASEVLYEHPIELEKIARPLTIELGARPARPLKVLARQTGPLIRRTALDVIESAIANASLKRRRRARKIVASYQPALQLVVRLMDLAQAVLDGNAGASAELRSILRQIPARTNSVFANAFSAGVRADIRTPEPLTSPGFSRSDCLLSEERFALLALAAARSADHGNSAADLMSRLEAGMSGVHVLERIHAKAAQALHGDPSTSFDDFADDLEFMARTTSPASMTTIDSGAPSIVPPRGMPRPPLDLIIPEIDWCDVHRPHCIYEVGTVVSTARDSEPYVIDDVVPQNACAGEQITVLGSGFNAIVIDVVFPRCGGGAIHVPPDSCTDTVVTVTVPTGATCGPIYLRILDALNEVCGTAIPVYQTGTPGYFISGQTLIQSFTVGGESVGTCVDPGQVVPITWAACPETAQVLLRIGNEPWVPVSTTGSQQWTAPNPVSEMETEVRLRVRSPGNCPAVERTVLVHVGTAPRVRIEGVEVTQGIQAFWSTNGTPDNSVPVIAGKDTAIRVYVSCDRGGFNGDEIEVTGSITLREQNVRLAPLNVNTSGTPDPFIRVGRLDRSRRADTNYSLNFRIPAGLASGNVTLDVNVWAMYPCTPPGDEAVEYISFRSLPPLPVCIRRIQGKAGNAPPIDGALDRVIKAFDYIPSPATCVTVLSGVHEVSDTVQLLGGYDDDPGLWKLSSDVADEHGNDGAIWVGLTYKFTRGMMPWPSYDTCIAYWDEPERIAHELGHCLLLGHVDTNSGESCLFVGCEDLPNGGLLTDVLFSPRTMAVVTGEAGVWDLMTYQTTRWTSAQHWVRMMGVIQNWQALSAMFDELGWT